MISCSESEPLLSVARSRVVIRISMHDSYLSGSIADGRCHVGSANTYFKN